MMVRFKPIKNELFNLIILGLLLWLACSKFVNWYIIQYGFHFFLHGLSWKELSAWTHFTQLSEFSQKRNKLIMVKLNEFERYLSILEFMALPISLQFQPNRQSNLLSLSPTNQNQLASRPTRTTELTLGFCHDHIHASPVSQPSIQTHKLDPHSHMQPLRIHIQPMKGVQLPHPWNGPQGLSSTPEETCSATDNHSIPQ